MEKLLNRFAQQKVFERCKEKNYMLIEPFLYKNSKSKIHLKCNMDNYEWYANYNNFIHNKTGCKKCTGTLKLTQEEAEKNILERCKEKNYVLTEPFIYKDNATKFHLKCNIDNYKWYISYYNFINGNRGCPKCGNRISLTQKEAEENVYKICKDRNFTLVQPFIFKNSGTKIHLKCNVDNYEWYATFHNLVYKKSGCGKCCKTAPLTFNEYEKNITDRCAEINYTVTKPLIQKNKVNLKNNINLKCNIDNFEWSANYNNFVNNKTGCPKCNNVAKITQQYAEQIINERCCKINCILIEPFIFKTNKTKIRLKCNVCNNLFAPTYNGFIHGETGCGKCNQSKGELNVMNYLNSKNIKYIREYKFDNCKYKRKLPFDFYLPENNTCIEFDGEQHFYVQNCWGGKNELNIIQIRDKIKNEYCKRNNIKLIRIKYNEDAKEFLHDIDNQINLVCNEFNNFIKNGYNGKPI
jgi:hypothetical protein